MMMSFYVRDNEKARRMSSIVLSAPENTPYSYYNADRNKTVKAGKVYFTEDCYLWVIPYGEDGSSSNWSGTFSETVYERDSDFTKVKIANAGDVYYFNSEVMVDDERVGVSLTGWALETNYIPNMESYESGEWWQIWSNTKTAIFANYMQGEFGERDETYRKEDLKFIGNINDGDLIEYPEIDDYYTIWTN
jgi:ketosteroid isomerase-like protein